MFVRLLLILTTGEFFPFFEFEDVGLVVQASLLSSIRK
jgi:hypothetical protein